MNKIIVFLIFNIIYISGFCFEKENLKVDSSIQEINDFVISKIIEVERERVISVANELLNTEPQTITETKAKRSKGGKHDYYSEGPYWWPNPNNPDGPFIRKDGLKYPGRFIAHRSYIGEFADIVSTETSAYVLTKQKKYADAAIKHMKAWFVDTATIMNPNMNYAQAIKGICSGRGTGIIDCRVLMDVAQSAHILEKSPYVSEKDIHQIKEWFRQFLTWLTAHPYGIKEMNAKNNHGTWWHAQVAAYARFVGDDKIIQLCREHYREILLPNQMAQDGRFPEELARTKPYSYSLFNLDATTYLLWILSENSMADWNYKLPDGRGLKKALNFMLPYLKDISLWPYPHDIDHWNAQPGARQFMLFAAINNQSLQWFNLWEKLVKKQSNDETQYSTLQDNILIWIDIENN